MTTNDLLVLLVSRYKSNYTESVTRIDEVLGLSDLAPGFPVRSVKALRNDLESFSMYSDSGLATRGTINFKRESQAYSSQRKKVRKGVGIRFWVDYSEQEDFPPEKQRESSFIVCNCIPILIQRVINQLLSNAYKYAPSGTEILVTHSIQERSICFQNMGPRLMDGEIDKLKEEGYRGLNAGGVLGNGQGLWLAEKAIELHSRLIAPISFTLYAEDEPRFNKDGVPYVVFKAKLCFDKYYFCDHGGEGQQIQLDGEKFFDPYIHDMWELVKRLYGNIRDLAVQFRELMPLRILLEDLWGYTDIIKYVDVLLNQEEGAECEKENYYLGEKILLNPGEVFRHQLQNLIECSYPNVEVSITGELSKQISISSGFYRLLSGFLSLFLRENCVVGELSIIFDLNLIEIELAEGGIDEAFLDSLESALPNFEEILPEDMGKYLPALYADLLEMIGCDVKVATEKLQLILPLK